MSKKYFTIEEKRCGWSNIIETRQGKRTVAQYRNQKTLSFFLVTLLFFLLSYQLYSCSHNLLLAVLMLLPGLYFLVRLIPEYYADCTVKCMFCSRDAKEAEAFIERICATHHLTPDSHEIVIEDGWYMVFRKDTKTR